MTDAVDEERILVVDIPPTVVAEEYMWLYSIIDFFRKPASKSDDNE